MDRLCSRGCCLCWGPLSHTLTLTPDRGAADQHPADLDLLTAICQPFMPEGVVGNFYFSPLGLCAFHTGVTLTHLSSFNMEAVDFLCDATMSSEQTVQRCRDGSSWALEFGASGKLNRMLCTTPPPVPHGPSIIIHAPPQPPSSPPSPPTSPSTQRPPPSADEPSTLQGHCRFAGTEDTHGALHTLMRAEEFVPLPFCGDLLQYPLLDPTPHTPTHDSTTLSSYLPGVDRQLSLRLSAFGIRLRNALEAGLDQETAVLSSHCTTQLRREFCRSAFPLCPVVRLLTRMCRPVRPLCPFPQARPLPLGR
jgi:hypothetical protein